MNIQPIGDQKEKFDEIRQIEDESKLTLKITFDPASLKDFTDDDKILLIDTLNEEFYKFAGDLSRKMSILQFKLRHRI